MQQIYTEVDDISAVKCHEIVWKEIHYRQGARSQFWQKTLHHNWKMLFMQNYLEHL